MGHCKDCKYWHQPDEWKDEDIDKYPFYAFGICGRFEGGEWIFIYVGDEKNPDYASLSTRRDFGCVLFEAKDAN